MRQSGPAHGKPLPSPTSHPDARKAVTGDKPRDLVCQRLAQQARRFPDLDPTGFDARLEPRDAAFAHAIYDAVIRRWLTLETLVRSRMDKPNLALDIGVQAALLSGAAQIIFLDRVPTHAIINHCVEWVKIAVNARAGGLVNALLRRVGELMAAAVNVNEYTIAHDEIPMEDGGAIRLPAPIFRGDPSQRLAAATSHPPAYIRAITSHFGPDVAKKLALHSLVRPPTVLCTHYATTLAEPGLTSHASQAHRVWNGDRPSMLALLERERLVWVQDASSSRAVLGLASKLASMGKVPRVIVDLCAGQGTKTRQLSAEFPSAVVIASDTDEERLKTLRAGALTTGGRIQAAAFDDVPNVVRELSRGYGADLVLLDVPCSNAGTLARRPEAKYRLASDQMVRLVPLQREIIAKGAALLAPDGTLVYSTCSIDPAENHDQAEWAASPSGPGLTLIEEEQTLPSAIPGEPAASYGDGSYFALLRRTRALAEPPATPSAS